MRVVVVAGGQWFRNDTLVIDMRHSVVARNGESVAFSRGVRGTSYQFRMVSYVLAAFPRPVSMYSLIELLWGDRLDGGPISAIKYIGKYVCIANKRLLRLGLKLRGTYQAGGGVRCEVIA